MQKSMFSAEEPPVNHSRSQDCGQVWTIHAANSCSPILQSLLDIAPGGSFGKTFPVPCPQTEDGPLPLSSKVWNSSGIMQPGECLTFSTARHFNSLGPSRSEETVCSLSDILETGAVPQKYYLSAKACRGILRRAEKRGKVLPELLMRALKAVADSEPTSS